MTCVICQDPCGPVGLCVIHLSRWNRYGRFHKLTTEDKFFQRVSESPDGCWLWARPQHDGYGRFTAGPSRVKLMAHRWIYEHMIAEIPEGTEIDHLCKRRNCVNPYHLDPVTQRVNSLRSDNIGGVNTRKVRCNSGHPFDVANTYITPDGRRECRQCRKAASARYNQRRARKLSAA